MTMRGMSAAVAALVAMLAFGATANAQSGGRLTYKQAKRLAVRLAEKQVRKRDLVSYHLLRARRVGRNAIVFAYDDRTPSDVFCTARVVVTRRVGDETTRLRARFRGQRCAKIPSDALAVESATQAAVRELRGTADATTASLRGVTRSIRRCQDLDVPRSRQEAVAAVVDIAIGGALARPNDEVLGDFVRALGEIQTSRPVLQQSFAAWADFLAAVRALPQISDPCATLQQWEQAGWAESESPVDMEEYRALEERFEVNGRAIDRAAGFLASVGVHPRAALRFTPDGLVLRLAPDLSPNDSIGKVALHKSALLR